MLPKGKISPSMMCAPLFHIPETVRVFEKENIDCLHIDVMDGCFVPNFALSTDDCAALRSITTIPFDYHFMVVSPEDKLDWFPIAKGDIVSVHPESTENADRAFRSVRRRGARAFAAISPETPVDALSPFVDEIDGVLVMTVRPGFAGQKLFPGSFEKIAAVRAYMDAHGREDATLEVDGCVSFENAVKMRQAGADLFVSGSSGVFRKDLPLEDAIRKFRAAVS